MVNKIIASVKRIEKLDIIKVFSFTSISTLVKMLTGFISVKVVAVVIGASGIALLGQLNNFSTIIMSVATGGITTGVTKYIAQYKDDPDTIKEYICTAVKIALFFSLLCGLILVFGSSLLSSVILLDAKYTFVFIVFGITLIFYTSNTLLLAVVNGYKQFNLYVKISIVSSVVGLILSLLLVIPFGVNGALLNAVTSQSLVFVIALFIAKRANLQYLSLNGLLGKFDKVKALQYFRFSLMVLVSAFVAPVSQLIIRGLIIDKFSIQAAGCWEGLNRISAMYLMIITSSFGVYYLPRLSEISSANALKKEIKTAYKVIIPCLLVGLTVVYFGRFVIIKMLFSAEFYEIGNLFLWQVIGDFLKISSFLIAHLILAKSMYKLYIVTEIIFSFLYVGISFGLMTYTEFGVKGSVMAYALNHAIYLFAMYLFVYRKLLCNSGIGR